MPALVAGTHVLRPSSKKGAVMSKSFVELKLLPKEQDLSQFVTDRFLLGKG
jgi:hypothetical protein